jgi:hypothetical protein
MGKMRKVRFNEEREREIRARKKEKVKHTVSKQ